MPAASSIFVFTKKTPFMQRVADLVRTGHTRFIQGEVPPEKAALLHEKFSRLYDCHLDKLQASRRRKAGFATSRLLFLHQESQERLTWVLLATPGRFPVEGSERLERWRDATIRDQRIQITGYELKRMTKPEEKKPVWTWVYTKEREQELREALIGAMRRKSDHDLNQLIHTIWRSPGFAGVRAQVKRFGELIKAEWKRSRKDGEALPEIPARIGYVQRLKDKGVFLPILVQKLNVERRKSEDQLPIREGFFMPTPCPRTTTATPLTAR